ncbi:DUF6456 domain-containing protein [Sphingorhabdus sp. Alg239-R122]|uniref:DUF6456 domain-containing protein n=1 Tax=Sphingorhabdus sp. Alg239-R122 TaxID=2305989 RepID=UPI0013D961B6|nr:DUF6456 domain-containing protein [Sphingorhabdus sp. Alg239-R122]
MRKRTPVKPQARNRMLSEQPLSDGHIVWASRGENSKPLNVKRSVTVNLAESPLAWLHARGYLTDRQFDAGERLRMDWERANLSPRVTMSWDPVRHKGSGSQGLTPTEMQIAAKDRFQKAESYTGRDLNDIAWRVICAGESVPVAEKELGWPNRSGKLVLRIALDRIADFYRLPGESG